MELAVLARARWARIVELFDELKAGDPVAWTIVIAVVVLCIAIAVWRKKRAARSKS